MSERTTIDFHELWQYYDSMVEMEKRMPGFMEDTLMEYSEELVETTKSLTPVDTGVLRDSWGLVTRWMVPYKRKMYSRYHKGVVKKTLFKRGGALVKRNGGFTMYTIMSNPQRYAENVEYGIREDGRSQTAYYMMHRAIALMKNRFPYLYEARLRRFMSEKGVDLL